MTVGSARQCQRVYFKGLPIPEELKRLNDRVFEKLLRDFQPVALKMPAQVLGASANPVRNQFVARQVDQWLRNGLRCLDVVAIQSVLGTGLYNKSITIPATPFIKDVFLQIVRDGLVEGLNALLRDVEALLVEVDDDRLVAFGLDEAGIENFRQLLPGFEGTLDELVDVAKIL